MTETEKLILLTQDSIISALGILLVYADSPGAAQKLRRLQDTIQEYIADNEPAKPDAN